MASTHSLIDLLRKMDGHEASDLFLTEGSPPAYRIHGAVRALRVAPTTRAELDDLLEHVMTPAGRAAFEARGDWDAGLALEDGRRYRLNLSRSQGCVTVVARAVPSGALDFEGLGLPPEIASLADYSRGLVLITGATGSGKSTTLAAMVHRINSKRPVHIVTVEDPIEFVHEDRKARVTQREVGTDTDGFHTALRHVLRQSPDVIVIGELRDMETIEVAVQASLTGHLVLATLHTLDTTQTLQRIMSFYPEHVRNQAAMDLALSLKGVVSQRLLPTKTGDSRVVACEVLTVTPPARKLLREQRITELTDLLRSSRDPGLRSFNRSLLDLYKGGRIHYDVGLAYATNPEEFALQAEGMATGALTFDKTEGTGTELDMKALLEMVLNKGASDLHLTVGRAPILRIAGRLHAVGERTLSTAEMRMLLFSVMSGKQRSQYELEREIDFSLALERGRRFRVNAYFQRGQMAAALRAISETVPDAETLGIPPVVLELGAKPQGLLLVVGPTGSGKSTTLACLVDRVNRTRRCRILTVEDPIEYVHTSRKATIDQREVDEDTLSFAAALRYVLRQDPDVILVGEMRDLETVHAALTAAETGHLVLATLHSNDAMQAIDRIIDVFPAAQQGQVRAQLGSSLLGVVSQRLLPDAEARGKRTGVFEVVVATPAMRNLIRENKLHQAQSIMETSRRDGMVTMDNALLTAVKTGRVRVEDAMGYMRNPRLLGELAAQSADPVEQPQTTAKPRGDFGWGRKR